MPRDRAVVLPAGQLKVEAGACYSWVSGMSGVSEFFEFVEFVGFVELGEFRLSPRSTFHVPR
jgi:hypothetical protein